MKTGTAARPSYPLMKQRHLVAFYHMQMPRWLFCDPKYMDLSLESKVAYTFLLNRFQLSQRNGWVNDRGEVFVIYTREELAREMQVSYKKAIACFQELGSHALIWETRMGRGQANRIFLAEVALTDAAASTYDCAPFSQPPEKASGGRPAETADLKPSDCAQTRADSRVSPVSLVAQTCEHGAFDADPISLTCENDSSEADPMPQTCANGSSSPAKTAVPDLPDRHTSNTNQNYKNASQNPVRPSVDDLACLEEIYGFCGLALFPAAERTVLRGAIDWLYFCGELRSGPCAYPGAYVRSRLGLLTFDILSYALDKLRANPIAGLRNTAQYAAKTLFHCITESESDFLLDPYLNGWKGKPCPA